MIHVEATQPLNAGGPARDFVPRGRLAWRLAYCGAKAVSDTLRLQPS